MKTTVSLYECTGNANLQAEDRLPVWYVMDEFGCRIQHSDEPKARVVPFFYLNEQAAYSLLFPITDLDEGEEVSRDFVEGCATDVVTRDALLSSWTSSFRKKYLPYLSLHQPEPSAEYFHVIFQFQFLTSLLSITLYNMIFSFV